MKIFRFAICALVVFAFGFTTSVKDVKLEYAFKVGDSFQMDQDSKQSIKQEIMGMGEMVINISITGGMSFKVVELTPTGAKLEVAYTSLKMITKSPMGDQTMDSESTNTEESKMMKALVNKPFFIYMNKRGKIEKAENVDNLYSGFKDLGFDDATLNNVKKGMEQMLGENSIKASLQMAFVTYPETALGVGSSWKDVLSAGMSFPLNIENTWKLSAVDGELANLEADGNIVTTDKDKEFSVNGMKAKSDLTGQQAMKSKVNTKNGWPTELKVLSEIKGTMTLLAGGMLPTDMEVPLEISTESTFVIKKK